MSSPEEAEERRKQFVADLVAVCKKHSVLIEMDDDEDDDWFMSEIPRDAGYGFCVSVWDLEEAVRMGVWDKVHGEGK